MENEVILEGFLKKWTGILTGWRERYFILKGGGILEFSDRNQGKDKGTIHLKIATIKLTPKDPLRITIHSGLKELNLRAGSIIDKYRWVSALREAAYGESNEQQGESSATKIPQPKRQGSTGSTASPKFATYSSGRESHLDLGFKRIHDYENQILGILAFLFKRTLSKDVREQVNKMDIMFKEMMRAIMEWKEAVSNEGERIERMKEKLDGYFDSLDNVRVNIDDGSVKLDRSNSEESGFRMRDFGKKMTGKSIFANGGESFAESSIHLNETHNVNIGGGGPHLSDKVLSELDVAVERNERRNELVTKQLSPIPDEGEERNGNNNNKNQESPEQKQSPPKVSFREDSNSNRRPEIIITPPPQEEKSKKSSIQSSPSKLSPTKSPEKQQQQQQEEVQEEDKEFSEDHKEEEEEKVGELVKTEKSRLKAFETSEDEEQFYSIVNPHISKINRTLQDKTLEGGTVFHTAGDDDMQSFGIDEDMKLPNLENPDIRLLKFLSPDNPIENLISKAPVELDPKIQKYLKDNVAFKDLEIPFAARRLSLPTEIPENIAEQAWSYTGVNTMEVPMSYHEPLSLLQKLCEQFEYSELLDQADEIDDSLLRMAYVIAFVISGYHTTSRRLTKPFDPLLGETYEFSSEDDNFKYVAEQISLEPPVTAFYGSSDHFELNSTMNMKTEFLGKCIEVKLEGKNEVKLKTSKDVYIFTRPITSLDHIMTAGKYCISNYGEMRFKNIRTNENATVSMIKRSWDEKGINRVEGFIKDAKAQFVYKITGRWDEEITIKNLKTNEEKQIWKRRILNETEKNFGFTHLALQLNYLYKDLIHQLPLTDSRFRPDVRALENGNYDLANREKRRLRDKEQKTLRLMKENNKGHQPKWFIPLKPEEGSEKSYIFNDIYFSHKLDDPEVPDLYN